MIVTKRPSASTSAIWMQPAALELTVAEEDGGGGAEANRADLTLDCLIELPGDLSKRDRLAEEEPSSLDM